MENVGKILTQCRALIYVTSGEVSNFSAVVQDPAQIPPLDDRLMGY